jgi:DNA repair and recombination RAD54-like protein
VERQAISCAHQLGQEKVVYIYHLIASETNEEEKYCRQVEKDLLSELVFSSSG